MSGLQETVDVFTPMFLLSALGADMKNELKSIISKLKKGKIRVGDIPEEYENDWDVIRTERALKLRKVSRCGYDVIADKFFVSEALKIRSSEWHELQTVLFDGFGPYFLYLEGDIYRHACYYQMDRSELPDGIDKARLFKRKAFIRYTIDDTQAPPADENTQYDHRIYKGYNASGFYVRQIWKDSDGHTKKGHEEKFSYFCDFVYYLKGNLSEADLLTCDGLGNLRDVRGLKFDRALLTSAVCRRLGLPYKKYTPDAPRDTTFSFAESNENAAALQVKGMDDLTPHAEADDELLDCGRPDRTDERIYYISDLHFYHLLMNRRAESKADILRVVRDVAETVIRESGFQSIILIDGDTSLDPAVFKAFLWELYRIKGSYRTIVFTLGNHDLWGYPDNTFDEIIEIYRSLLQKYGMYLLQNDVLYLEEDSDGRHIRHISEQELESAETADLRNKARAANLILFGGTGFAGCNQEYNASTGLYRYNNTIGYDRNFELEQSKKTEHLYNKILATFYDKNVIVATHMPLYDWYQPAWELHEKYASQTAPNDSAGLYEAYHPGFAYVSGHTHRNFRYDDGGIQIYADNQFGYNRRTPERRPHLKSFDFNGIYDYFSDYEDGIHEISADEYKAFYQGKRIQMIFNRTVDAIYMLKKHGYYCFLQSSNHGRLYLLNGGAYTRLDITDVNHYYDNMDRVISTIKSPLDKYTAFQKAMSKEVKKLGGNGFIHGCIIDIDDWNPIDGQNHIFINPNDMTITAYWALDMVYKLIYPSVPVLLEARCPRLYEVYKKMLDNGQNFLARQTEGESSSKPNPYLSTDIYRMSRPMRKLQRLNSNILSVWPDKLPEREALEFGEDIVPMTDKE